MTLASTDDVSVHICYVEKNYEIHLKNSRENNETVVEFFHLAEKTDGIIFVTSTMNRVKVRCGGNRVSINIFDQAIIVISDKMLQF